MGEWLEAIWRAGHGAVWGRWEILQLAAIAAGAALFARGRGRSALAPFFAGTLAAAALGAIAGSAGPWLAWLRAPRGAPPEIEIAGYGALAGLALGVALVAAKRGDSAARALDELAPSIGIMLAVARIGCFFAGCDFGAPTGAAWAIRYPAETAAYAAQRDAGLLAPGAPMTLAVHPTQLYESLAGLALSAIALATPLPAKRRQGTRFTRVIFLYACARFAIDLVRGDLAPVAFGCTATQLVSLAVAAAIVLWRTQPPARVSTCR